MDSTRCNYPFSSARAYHVRRKLRCFECRRTTATAVAVDTDAVSRTSMTAASSVAMNERLGQL